MPALIAEPGPQMVFFRAARAVIGQLSRWHGDEEAIMPFDQLDIAHNERVVEGERTECLETACAAAGAKVDAYFCQMHGESPQVERCGGNETK
jgi:hypothetical protein